MLFTVNPFGAFKAVRLPGLVEVVKGKSRKAGLIVVWIILTVVFGLEIVFFALGGSELSLGIKTLFLFLVLVTFSSFFFKKRGVLEALAFCGDTSLLLFVNFRERLLLTNFLIGEGSLSA